MKKAERYLLKSKLSTLYQSCTDQELKKEVLTQYKNLLSNDTQTNKNIIYQNKNYIYPSIAFYFASQKYSRDKEKITKQIEAEILATGTGMSKFLSKISRSKFFFALFKKMCYMSTKTTYQQPYFDMEWTEAGKDKIAWNCHKCHFYDEFTRQKCPELTKIFCRLDDVMYGNIPTAKWARTKTLGDGDEICDFCFIKTEKLEVN